jgi:hypothetical protein
MTYSHTKPDSGLSPAIDVTQIQTNFSQYATIFSNNHTALNNANQGDHEGVILTEQTNDPGVTQNLDVLYCKAASGSSGIQPQLFVQIPTFLPTANDPTVGPFAPLHMTFNVVNTSGPVYQSFLPGGNLLYFGTVSSISTPITLSPAPSSILVAIATPNNVQGFGNPFTVSTTINSASTFTINSNATGVFTFTWIAIGTK